MQGWRQGFSDEGLTLPMRGLKYGCQGATNAQNIRKNRLSPSDGGDYGPLAFPWRHPCDHEDGGSLLKSNFSDFSDHRTIFSDLYTIVVPFFLVVMTSKKFLENYDKLNLYTLVMKIHFFNKSPS